MPYFDANASAPLRPVVTELLRCVDGRPLNPSSPHRYGREARRLVEDARRAVARAADAPPGTALMFVSGGTEANNTVMKSFGFSVVLACATEHSSVLAAAPEQGTRRIPVDRAGRVNLAWLDMTLADVRIPGKTLVSVSAANNETGVLQDLPAVAEIVRRHGALFHTDASQAFGKIPFSMQESGADFVTLSAHKLGGLPGAGALLFPERLGLTPLLAGGGQERRMRSGTENVLAIQAFGYVAAEIAAVREGFEACRPLIRLLESSLPKAVFAGAETARLPNTSCLISPGIRGDVRMAYLDAAGYAVSLGSACSSGRAADSHVLEACGFSLSERESAVRVSLAPGATREETEGFVALWRAMDERAAAS